MEWQPIETAPKDGTGWTQIWQVTDVWWMVGFQRNQAVIIAAVIGDRLRVFSPTNQKFQLRNKSNQVL